MSMEQQVKLERLKFCLLQKFSKSELATTPDIQFADAWAEGIYFRIMVEVFGQNLAPVIIRHPADWWQALKGRFAPRWFLRRWPVKNVTHTVDFRFLYPTLPAVPGHNGVANVYVTRDIES